METCLRDCGIVQARICRRSIFSFAFAFFMFALAPCSATASLLFFLRGSAWGRCSHPKASLEDISDPPSEVNILHFDGPMMRNKWRSNIIMSPPRRDLLRDGPLPPVLPKFPTFWNHYVVLVRHTQFTVTAKKQEIIWHCEGSPFPCVFL